MAKKDRQPLSTTTSSTTTTTTPKRQPASINNNTNNNNNNNNDNDHPAVPKSRKRGNEEQAASDDTPEDDVNGDAAKRRKPRAGRKKRKVDELGAVNGGPVGGVDVEAAFVMVQEGLQSMSNGLHKITEAFALLATTAGQTLLLAPPQVKEEPMEEVKRGRKKLSKDPNRPRHPKNGFLIFCDDFRREAERDEVKIAPKEFMRLAGIEWQKMDEGRKA
ncbi:hypothetical protein HDU67_008637, partial [Dinochytrium kinnereticum]